MVVCRLADQTQAKLNYAYANRVAVAFHVDVAAPVLVVPHDVSDDNSMLLAIDLGRFQLSTTVLRNNPSSGLRTGTAATTSSEALSHMVAPEEASEPTSKAVGSGVQQAGASVDADWDDVSADVAPTHGAVPSSPDATHRGRVEPPTPGVARGTSTSSTDARLMNKPGAPTGRRADFYDEFQLKVTDVQVVLTRARVKGCVGCRSVKCM